MILTFDTATRNKMGSPHIFHNFHEKLGSDWAKSVVCILSTRFYTQSAKVDLDLDL